jgi:hypothetical protein
VSFPTESIEVGPSKWEYKGEYGWQGLKRSQI